jgi:ABC-type sugar transport system permease subunit
MRSWMTKTTSQSVGVGDSIHLFLERSFLINHVDGRSDENFLGVMLVREGNIFAFWPVASDGSESDDSEDPEHPKEDTETTSDDKSNGTTFPGAERGECKVKPLEETGLPALAMEVTFSMEFVVVVVVPVVRCFFTLLLDSSFSVFFRLQLIVRDLFLVMMMVMLVMNSTVLTVFLEIKVNTVGLVDSFNKRHSQSRTESIR